MNTHTKDWPAFLAILVKAKRPTILAHPDNRTAAEELANAAIPACPRPIEVRTFTWVPSEAVFAIDAELPLPQIEPPPLSPKDFDLSLVGRWFGP